MPKPRTPLNAPPKAPTPARLIEEVSASAEEMDRRLAAGRAERRRREELHTRFRDKVEAEAKARGDEPYRLLVEAIRRLLRE